MKSRKVDGHDEMMPKNLKQMGEPSLTMLKETWRKRERELKDWKMDVIMLIFKKGDNLEISNYRDIQKYYGRTT